MISILYFLILLSFLGIQVYLWWIASGDQELWEENNSPKTNFDPHEYPSVSILVPVRNEENDIKTCLRSLVNQNYPANHLQIIVINDHSTDRTVNIVDEFTEVQVINQTKGISGKKAALQVGIESSDGELILTIDGDCEVGENWVATMIQQLGNNPNALVTGPVWMIPDSPNFLQKYQEMEQAALNVLTYSGLKSGLILSASGANMAYPRALYSNHDPYAENEQIPSGDDVFFAQKVDQSGGEVRFARQREAIVYTSPVSKFSDFIRQRLRWAGKSSGYTHWPTKLYMVGFGAVNLSFVVLLVAGIWHPIFYSYLFYGLVLKFIVDYLIIHTGMRWGNRPVCWQDVLKASLFQIFYVVYVTVLLVSGKKAGWKE